jgi:hypothetical protein
VGGLEPQPGAADHAGAGQAHERRVVVLAVGEHGQALRSGDHRVLRPAREVHDGVAGADLVDGAVDPRQARALEHEEDLLLGAVLVHGPGAAARLDVDQRHADGGRTGRLAERAERRAHLADVADLALDVVPVRERHASPSQYSTCAMLKRALSPRSATLAERG